MEEAEELCDRVGIFVSGNFHCLGTPSEVCTLVTRINNNAGRVKFPPGKVRTSTAVRRCDTYIGNAKSE
jgi:ABC-type multidrug transport system ATPase subunit